MKWTNEQRMAIEYGGENILLAAAAGSGKTAVLVQRVIEMVCDPEKRIDINELLILTFTEAAAREMREKIAHAIEKVLEENPESEHLQRQKLLLHSANISTIHSFCLNVLKSNIHLTGLPVGFGLVSETENKIMLSEALDEVLERFYGKINIDSSIADLVMGYGGIKNDATLRETILGLYYFSKSMPNPAKWMNGAIRPYMEIARAGSLSGQAQMECFWRIVKDIENSVLGVYEQINNEIQEQLSPDHPYAAFFAEEEASLKRVFKGTHEENYEKARELIFSFEFQRLPSGKRGAESDTLLAQDKVKALRELTKALVGDLYELFINDEAEVMRRIKGTYPRLRTLKNMVLMLDRRHIRMKRAKNFLDFGDLEHETLKLLTDCGENSAEVVARLRNKYKEILIDEYQDTNNIQDTLFRLISRDNSNVFMVGDLKQSIYTFRNAVPGLFSEKYKNYETVGGGKLIRLFKNFRSRDEVVNTVNFVFRNIMSEAVGDVNYTKEEYLVRGAEYPENESPSCCNTEFHLICSNPDDATSDDPTHKTQLEARVVAERIRRLINEKTLIFDKEKGEMRPVAYKDIVILMRNTKAATPVFEQVFADSKIPLYTEVGRGYLSSPEVRTVLAFLQVVDNPRQDIPLIAVLRSPIWGFSPEELAEIRSLSKHGAFYDAVIISRDKGNEKAEKFLSALTRLREEAEYMSIERLIYSIYYEYGYYMYSGALSRGAERQANLRLLLERAMEFERTRLSGLFGFMNYIETIKTQGDDLTPAKTLGDDENVVRIITIHKSKGLEFPVVILSDTTREFNSGDIKKNIIWNSYLGIGADFVDTKLRVRYPSLLRNLVVQAGRQELYSEEMRLLYVALTRAREKIIVTSTYKQTKKGLALPLFNKSGEVKPEYIRGKNCFRDWLIAAFSAHSQGEEIRNLVGLGNENISSDAGFNLDFVHYGSESEIPEIQESLVLSGEISGESGNCEFGQEVADRMDFGHGLDFDYDIPVKLSVSEVKRMQTDEEYVPILDELKVHELHDLNRPTGAEKGTIVHFLLQLATPGEINSVESVERLVESLISKKILTSRQAECIEPDKVFAFFSGELGQRMKTAVRLEREFSFYTEAKVNEIYKDCTSSEKILLQGIMDCFFVDENGKVVLLDFKTDRVRTREEALIRAKKYTVQMKYYKKALEEILEKEVDECWLCFLECGENIKI